MEQALSKIKQQRGLSVDSHTADEILGTLEDRPSRRSPGQRMLHSTCGLFPDLRHGEPRGAIHGDVQDMSTKTDLRAIQTNSPRPEACAGLPGCLATKPY